MVRLGCPCQARKGNILLYGYILHVYFLNRLGVHFEKMAALAQVLCWEKAFGQSN
jgi:hypothetical protein